MSGQGRYLILTKASAYGFSCKRPSEVPYHPILAPSIQPQLCRNSGNWPSTGCNIDQFFAIGQVPGNANIFNETCSGNCYNDYVVGNGSNYATAYFEVGYVRVFSNNFTGTTSSGGSTNASGSSSASGIRSPKSTLRLLAYSLIIAVSLALL